MVTPPDLDPDALDGGVMERRCENCRFWDNSSTLQDAENTGLCRRREPRIDKRSGRATWPYSEDVDWCAKFRVAHPDVPKADKDRP